MKTIFKIGIIHLIIICIMALSSKASNFDESFIVNFDEPEVTVNINSSVIIEGIFINIGTQINNYHLELINIDLPQGWSYFMCDPNLCLNPGVNESDFEYPPIDTGYIKVNFFVTDQPDTATMDLVVSDLFYDYIKDTVHLKVVSEIPSYVNETGNFQDITVYPTVASDRIFIKISNNDIDSKIQIIDLLGRMYSTTNLIQFNGELETSIKVCDLPKGMYYLLFSNKKVNKNIPFFVE